MYIQLLQFHPWSKTICYLQDWLVVIAGISPKPHFCSIQHYCVYIQVLACLFKKTAEYSGPCWHWFYGPNGLDIWVCVCVTMSWSFSKPACLCYIQMLIWFAPLSFPGCTVPSPKVVLKTELHPPELKSWKNASNLIAPAGHDGTKCPTSSSCPT